MKAEKNESQKAQEMLMVETHDSSTKPATTECAPESVLRKEIRLDLIFKLIFQKWQTYIVPMVATIVLTAIYVYSLPRYYTVKVMLAPEMSNSGGGLLGSLGGLASMAGVNLSSLQSNDAIIPLFYPDLMTSTDFIVPLLHTQVSTKDGSFKGSYVDYLTKKCDAAWWDKGMAALVEMVKPTNPKDLSKDASGRLQINPFNLNVTQEKVVRAAKGNIDCNVDKKTDVITLTTTAQDPLVAAQMADTVKANLQQFITSYRTHKAKNDFEHYTKLMHRAKLDYEKAQKKYAAYVDANQDVVLASYRVKEENLENELQMAYNTYSQLKIQVQLAEAKVMERTPAFTTLQNASVPIKPAGPKRVLTIAFMMVVCFIIKSIHLVLTDKRVKF